MLRHTLCRWLERKSVRPVMSRAGRAAGRSLPTSIAAAAAAAPSSSTSPGYRTGDVDDLEGSESLDLMDDIPIEPLGRPLRSASSPTAAAPPSSARNVRTQEMLSRLDHKYHLSPTGAQNEAEGHRADARHQQRSTAQPARRVMSTLRRPHASPSSPHSSPATAAAADGGDGEESEYVSAVHSTTSAAHTGDREEADENEAHSGDAAQSLGSGSEAAEGEGGATSASPTAAKSADAYRFLLNHIDAEIAALQRRHSSVTTRRQNVQTRQTQRIKDLFELIEAPWTLLPTEMQPALPATGVDVYLKEQQLAKLQRHGGASSGAASAGHDGQDKMYVLALHKNYKSMPAGRKRFYEEAANYNAAVREEMKYQLTRGCTRFEAFLDRVKECTMEMAREGQVPELPSGHAQQRFHGHRGNAGYRPDEPRRTPAPPTDTAQEASKGRQQRQSSGAAEGEGEGARDAAAAERGAVTVAEDFTEGHAEPIKAAAKKGKRASRRIKDAAKASAKAGAKGSSSNISTASETSKPVKKTRAGSGKAATRAKSASSAKASVSKKAKSAKAAKASSDKGGRGKKAAAAPTTSANGGASRSIPLPNLNQLALKKIKQLAAPSGKKPKATAPKATKAKSSSSSGKKKKK